MTMNKWMETFLAAIMALGPTIIAVTMMQHYGPLGIACSLIFSGIYMLVLVLALTLRSCLRQRNSQSDQEQLQNTEEEEDSPPSYEVVTSKPPPYSLLFASAPPTGDVRTCAMRAEGQGYVEPVHHLPPCHTHQHKGVLHCFTWIMMDPDASPPSYFEAVSENSPTSPSPPSSGGNTPPSTPTGATATAGPPPLHGGSTPPSSSHNGTTPSTPPTAHMCDTRDCTTHPTSSDTKHFPT